MTAWPEQRAGGLVATVAARAEAWLFEPAGPRAARAEPQAPRRAVVAVIGLGPRCGTTTVARAVAVELAGRDPAGAALVTAPPGGAATPLATGAARRLARALGGRAVGRLALVDVDDPACRALPSERPAPLVLDVGHGTPPEVALALADQALLVASPDVEPALAEVAAAALARDGFVPLVVLNRVADAPAGWHEEAEFTVGESRLGARLALAGREPLGSLGSAAAALADACGQAVPGG